MRIRLAVLLVVVNFACTSRSGDDDTNGSSGSSTSSSGSPLDGGTSLDGGALETYEDYCLAAATTGCQPSCDSSFDRARCIASSQGYCLATSPATRGWVYHSDAARECVERGRQYTAAVNQQACEFGVGPVNEFNRVTTWTSTCVDDRSQRSLFFEACYRVLTGTQPLGAPCVSINDCSPELYCPPVPDNADAGCSACASRTAGLGQPCVARGFIRYEVAFLRCPDNATCAMESGTCVPQAPLGGDCGVGVAYCAEGCNQYCSRLRPDGGTCQHYAEDGEDCDYSGISGRTLYCNHGLSCLPVVADGGLPDYTRPGKCTAAVGLGAPCSRGGLPLTAPSDPPYNPRGNWGTGPLPTCIEPFLCYQPDGGATGTCVGFAFGATGDRCGDNIGSVLQACTNRDSCVGPDGGRVCTAPTPGGTCSSDDDCSWGSYCVGGGSCREFQPLGAACDQTRPCVRFGYCLDGLCVPQGEDIEPFPALCQ